MPIGTGVTDGEGQEVTPSKWAFVEMSTLVATNFWKKATKLGKNLTVKNVQISGVDFFLYLKLAGKRSEFLLKLPQAQTSTYAAGFTIPF